MDVVDDCGLRGDRRYVPLRDSRHDEDADVILRGGPWSGETRKTAVRHVEWPHAQQGIVWGHVYLNGVYRGRGETRLQHGRPISRPKW